MRSARLSIAFACVAALTLASCLDPIEPTAVSPIVTISPVSASAVTLPQTTVINATFTIVNSGTTTIRLDANYRRLEKLVDQRWKLANEQGSAPVAPVTLQPGRTIAATYGVGYDPESNVTNPLLVQPRGVYRMRFRIFLSLSVSDTLAADQSYSQPFSVDCC